MKRLYREFKSFFVRDISKQNLSEWKQTIIGMKQTAIDRKLENIFKTLSELKKIEDRNYSKFLLIEANQSLTTKSMNDIRGDLSNVLREIHALLVETGKKG